MSLESESDRLKREILDLIGAYERLQREHAQPGAFELIRSTFEAEDMQAAVEVLLSGQVSMGSRVRAFEQAWNKWNSAEASLMVNSGSSANLLALSALAAPASAHPIRPGDEV
ncbi:MAG: DegT/DnrJ/EryC1/StrS family aminotransferase, partial [Candidatus Sericytochromatia bacterium]